MTILTRRGFLRHAACAAAVTARVARRAPAGGIYVSLNGSVVNKPDRPLAWPEFVRLAGKLGYGGVDVNLTAAFEAGVDATRALLSEADVRPAIANLPLQLLTPDERAFDEGLERLPDYARFMTAIGLDRLMAVLSPGSPVPREERHRFVRARLARVAGVLGPAGIRLGLEFLGVLEFRRPPRAPHSYIWTLPDTLALAAEVAPNIGVVLDIWHWHHSGGTTADILATPKARLVHLHVSDARAEPPEAVRDNGRLLPGEGIIDSAGFFGALKRVGYEGGVSPEPLGRIPPEMTPEDGARVALDTTVAALKRAGIAPARRP